MLIFTICCIAYVLIFIPILGYVKDRDDYCYENRLPSSGAPELIALFWPITLLVVAAKPLAVWLYNIGSSFSKSTIKKEQRKLEETKQRIAEQAKLRIELQQAEQELETQFQELEMQEEKNKETMRKFAKSINDQLFK